MLWCAVVWCRYGMVWHLHDKSSVSRSGGTCYQLLLHMHLPCTWNVARTFSRSARWRIRGFRTRVWWPQTHSTEDHLCARLVPCDSLRLPATPCDLANIWKSMPSPSWRLEQEWESPGSVQTVKEPKGTLRLFLSWPHPAKSLRAESRCQFPPLESLKHQVLQTYSKIQTRNKLNAMIYMIYVCLIYV